MIEHPEPPADTAAAFDTAATLTLASELRVVLGQLIRQVREVGTVGDLTPSQKAVLRRLEVGGPSTMSTLARLEGVRPQSMGATVAVLDAAGLVSGSTDPRDGRKTVLSLTESAVQQFTTGRLAREDWLFHAMQTELTATEQQQLASSIVLLRRLLRAS
ncbi:MULTISPECIES: MarR family winged helix-turn-helix transcriptional regulator [Subtercola]|uniref:MarR family transcriptional regulator n=1 Tax=Subtercola vilae TaxID=2056433 RepID=A0A4T2BTQ2_9MICO|nr:MULTISPECIES: MarR family transcriptional regulator [Subtercola]MEA9985598.1 MarR family transcriptional regulator [Subtercola sp. RTI3]TIH34827.1 MarR family transcriptional regulator [Subtercola vilae]